MMIDGVLTGFVVYDAQGRTLNKDLEFVDLNEGEIPHLHSGLALKKGGHWQTHDTRKELASYDTKTGVFTIHPNRQFSSLSGNDSQVNRSAFMGSPYARE
jgi:hypothetical protein